MTEKEKYLASAQKHVLKGSLERAIKDYEQLVALDPKDLRLRQRLAELLARVNRKDEAVREYETIARFYADNAYYLKAIAVYKQIQKLTPLNMAVPLLLAELNERQGLKGNALAEYQAVLLTYETTGEYGAAAQVLERMILLDPEQSALHLRLAEFYLQTSYRDRGYREFLRTAILQSQVHDATGFSLLCERVRELFPERMDFFVDLAGEQLRSGKADEAVLLLQALLEEDDSNRSAWLLLADAYEACGDRENVKDTYGRLTLLSPHDPIARERYISCLIAEGNEAAALAQLESCLTFFPAEQIAPFEKFFLKISQMTPSELRPLVGLQEIYVRCEAPDKLAEVEARIEALGKGKVEVEVEVTEEVQEEEWAEFEVEVESEVKEDITPFRPAVEGMAELDVEVMEEAPAEVESVDVAFSWEEELDLPLEAPTAVDAEADEEISADSFLVNFDDDPSSVYQGGSIAPGGNSSLEEGPALLEAASGSWGDAEPFDLDLSLDSLFPSSEDAALPELPATSAPEPTASKPSGKYGVELSPSEFGRVLDGQIDRDDTESHYSLGIAYKEMGLYGFSLEEFRLAARSPRRRIDALLLQGVCYRESGEPDRARELLLSLLEEGGGSPEESAGILYELALLAEGEKDPQESCRFLREIQESLPGFRDVVARMTTLGCPPVEEPGGVEEAEPEEWTGF